MRRLKLNAMIKWNSMLDPQSKSRGGEPMGGRAKEPAWPSMTRLAISMLALWLCIPADAQVQDIYRISSSAYGSHVDYQNVELKPGMELRLADLSGPGKITYFYITDSSKSHISRDLVLKVIGTTRRSRAFSCLSPTSSVRLKPNRSTISRCPCRSTATPT